MIGSAKDPTRDAPRRACTCEACEACKTRKAQFERDTRLLKREIFRELLNDTRSHVSLMGCIW